MVRSTSSTGGTGWLSQGERSRLALARALATRATVLLLDEPLSHVDPVRKPTYWNIVRRIVAEENISMVFTSHEPETVLRYAEHVICLHNGSVAFEGPVRTLYDNPPDAHAGAFLGPLNWFRADEAAAFLTRRAFGSDVAIRPERLQIQLADDSEIELVSTPFIGPNAESIVRHVASGMTKSVLHQVPEVAIPVGQRVAFRESPQSGASV
ncbi:MAG: ATP-binding cassette domain-containing protein [Planctomycetaceae bacterium]